MLHLRPMTDEELAGWLVEIRRNYAQDRMAAGEPEATAQRLVDQQLADYFPGGRVGEGHEILVAELDGERVGTVWPGPYPRRPPSPTTAWLYDIELDERFRGQGLGRELLDALERRLAGRGVTELSLNVFGGNDRARRLYVGAGYREVAVTMTKSLGDGPAEDSPER